MAEQPGELKIEPYDGPSGGWGSVESLAEIIPREEDGPAIVKELFRQNKHDGFMCVSCAWPKPAKPHPFEFCENGAKATAWEITKRRTTPEFFAEHTVTELQAWPDYDLEQQGRLTEPLRYNPDTDKYERVAWADAFAEIGKELAAIRARDPKKVVFYSSGRASLETSYMYALFARIYGNNNLPDSSNMCHETTSVALKASVGAPVGTTVLDDFEHCDAIFFFGQNVGSNSPRMLHPLQIAARRGVEIVVFNPLRERGLERFTNPQGPVEMALRQSTRIATQYHQVKAGGDIAAILGICKWVIEHDDAEQAAGRPGVLDHGFIAEHTHGFDAVAEKARSSSWEEIEENSGLRQADIEKAAKVYARANAVIGIYGMGLTQHVGAMHNVYGLVNLLLLKGNIGKLGAGLCPVRGHSNVQGQRTVGISEKPELVPLDRLKAQYGFEPPTQKGLTTVDACEAIAKREVEAFVGLGGNFVRAIPDHSVMEPAWKDMRLTVQIATKLNRSHLINGKVAYLLPCLGRIEKDVQNGVAQAVSMEDSTSCIHGSMGEREPASPHLLSEPKIVAEIAKAALGADARYAPWDGWVADYATCRDAIEETYPDQFARFNQRMWDKGGFHRPNTARDRRWLTKSQKAEFNAPPILSATGFEDKPGRYRLITLRSNDQFNTTVYGYDDRFRGIKGTRMVVLMNPQDIVEAGLSEGQEVTLEGDSGDDVERKVAKLRVTPYDIPRGCLGGYYPECNPLIPVAHHAQESKVPAAKSVPVRISAG